MDKTEIGQGSLRLTLDSALLERQAASLETRLRGVFDDMGRDLSARFPARTAPVSRVLADWERQAARLGDRFSRLGETMGGALAIAMTPAAETMNGLMDTALRTADTLRSFVFSLLGRKTSDAAADTAESITAVGGSAGSAGRQISAAASQVRRSLMAFDQINRLTADTASGAGRSSGSGRNGLSEAAERTEELLRGNIFGEYLRSLLDEKRFYEAGAALAAKAGQLIDGLDDALNASGFREKLRGRLGAVTDTVNGVLDGLTFTEADRQSVAGRIGDFLGDAVGLALESAHLVLTGLHWDNLGRCVAQCVNGALASLREQPIDLGTVLSDWLNAGLASADGFFRELDWAGLGDTISRNINSWFENVDWELAGTALHDGITGLRETVLSAIAGMDIRWSDILSAFGRGLLGEDHPGLSKLLFGESGLTVEVGGVTDVIPRKKKLLSGFTAGLGAWLESFAGQDRGKRLDFTASLEAWTDALPDKTLDFRARLREFTDAMSGKSVDFSARLTSWKDALAGKVTDFTARLSSWTDALRSKSVDFRAVFSSWSRSSQWLSGGDAWNAIAMKAKFTSWTNALPSVPKIEAQAIIKNAVTGKAEGGVLAGGVWRPVTAYAAGGSPSGGQLFVAREAGPELVGTLGGHTAVMNNDQIVASVSAGVARAVSGIRFYSQDAATPHLAVIDAGVSRSEKHLASIESRLAGGASGSGRETLEVLRQILQAVTTMDRDVYLDGVSVKDRVVELINRGTQATGVCEIMV